MNYYNNTIQKKPEGDDLMEELVGEQAARQKYNPHKFIRQNLKTLKGRLSAYCEQVPVLSFNGGRYDLNLIKGKLAKHLNLSEDRTYVIKRNNSYSAISTPQLKFLDIMNILAPGVSYSKFLKAYGIEECKGFLPYEFLDSADKLTYNRLPDYDRFYSSLKRHNLLNLDGKGQDNYKRLQNVWNENNMQSLQDLLVWYNNFDVSPFVKAVQKLQQFYYTKKIDTFKIGISLPAISRILLYQSSNAYLPLFSYDTESLYKIIKRNIYGGPSVIFNKHFKVGENSTT